MIKLATQSNVDETTDELEEASNGTTLTVVGDDDPLGDEYPVDESNDDDAEPQGLVLIQGEDGVFRGIEEHEANNPLPAVATEPEKILQVPDSVRERDLRMIEAHQNDIREQRSLVRNRYIAWCQAKSEAKAAKDAYDESVANLLGIIDEGPVRQHSLFPAAPVAEAPPVVVEEGEPEAATLTTEEELPPGHYIHPDWQSTPIGEFFEHPDVDTNLIELTQDFEIETLGELVSWLDAEENGGTIPTYLTDEQLAKVRAAILESKLTTKKPAATAPTDDESWRTVAIDDLDLPKSLKEKLRDGDFLCIGDIADFTSTGKNLTDIKGVGEKKAEQIQEALDKVWESRKAME